MDQSMKSKTHSFKADEWSNVCMACLGYPGCRIEPCGFCGGNQAPDANTRLSPSLVFDENGDYKGTSPVSSNDSPTPLEGK